jgi:hypothetical protein
MSEKPQGESRPVGKVKALRCRRTGQTFSPAEHDACPYCYGGKEAVERGGQYEDFCDYRPGKDPINFGFPPDTSRNQQG